MSPNTDLFMERLAQFDHKLRSYSKHFAYRSEFMDADDLYQTAVLKLWERFCNEPDLLKNNNSYLWVFGVWMMKNAVNHERNVWVKKIVGIDCKDEEESKLTVQFPLPEAETAREEVRDIARQMPEEYRTLYYYIAQGYRMKEIAPLIGVRKENLAKRKRIMMETLCRAWRVTPVERGQLIREM